MASQDHGLDVQRPPGVLLPGLLLGVGLGGFVDGILLHQVLQWHHMLTSTGEHPATTVAGLEINTRWDGFFHAFTWLAVVVGLFVLGQRVTSRRGPWPRTGLFGAVLAGWGVFNLAEGIIDHHILGIHHVRTDVGNVLLWDLGFLALGPSC